MTMGVLHEARVFIVGEKPATKAERSLLFKIDSFILSFLKEEIGFTGIQYNIAVTIFLGAYTLRLC
ncbi:hypothetical protein PG993_013259 [Apiospora rasikravindrae]|uniref:Uncharacterized protein n=1 Tax=Apiospora rasikravindrae TaxID=990691 RepID=A0ABR1RYD4_9PEZI